MRADVHKPPSKRKDNISLNTYVFSVGFVLCLTIFLTDLGIKKSVLEP